MTISTSKAEKILKKRDVQAFWVCLNKEVDTEKEIDDVPIVHKFEDVFPEALPGTSPNRQLEFYH